MKKISLVLVILLLVLSGCNNGAKQYQEQVKVYTSLWTKVLNNDKFTEIPAGTQSYKATNYTLKGSLVKNDAGTYDYGITLSKPYRALYNVEVIVLPSLADVDEKVMVPNIGVFEEQNFNLVPYQVNNDKGYVSGLVVNGETLETELTMYILVIWHDESLLTTHEEYYSYPVSLSVNP